MVPPACRLLSHKSPSSTDALLWVLCCMRHLDHQHISCAQSLLYMACRQDLAGAHHYGLKESVMSTYSGPLSGLIRGPEAKDCESA